MNRLTIIGFLILFVVIIFLGVDNEFLRNKPVQVDTSLQIKIDSLAAINYTLEGKIIQYKASLDSLSKRKAIKEQKIIYLKKSEDEKVLAIDTLSSNELYNVFAGFTP